MNLSENHIKQVAALKRCYPYRIIWAAIDNEGREIQGADYNRRQINKMARLGYKVFVVLGDKVFVVQ